MTMAWRAVWGRGRVEQEGIVRGRLSAERSGRGGQEDTGHSRGGSRGAADGGGAAGEGPRGITSQAARAVDPETTCDYIESHPAPAAGPETTTGVTQLQLYQEKRQAAEQMEYMQKELAVHQERQTEIMESNAAVQEQLVQLLGLSQQERVRLEGELEAVRQELLEAATLHDGDPKGQGC